MSYCAFPIRTVRFPSGNVTTGCYFIIIYILFWTSFYLYIFSCHLKFSLCFSNCVMMIEIHWLNVVKTLNELEKLKHIPFPKQNSQSAHIWGWGGREGDRAVRRPIRLHAAQCGECAVYRNPVQGTAKPGTLPTMHHSPRVILGVFSFNGVSAARAIRDEITLAALWCHALVSLCSAASSRTHLFSYVFM